MYDKDLHIEDALFKTPQVLEKFNSIAVGISGGADSDVVLDMIVRSGCDLSKVHFIFSDTGLELQATKNHLDELEKKYGVKIERIRAVKSIPTCCKDHGQPFLNKVVSMHIERLQSRGFKWEDEPFEVLVERYPHTISSLKWWCNKNPGVKFNIMNNKWLKEFLISTPPNSEYLSVAVSTPRRNPF
jgi:3'-phosphoadenosine 5'-phosphosulfate sulfotransferase (PAPS reductase)/FAD synthetase